jgi:hypothetical protein
MKRMVLLGLLLGSSSMIAGQRPSTNRDLHYLLLATQRTSTMQKELDVAARQGYRVVAGLPHSDEVVLLLDRMPPESEPYSYRLLATNRTSTMEKELNEAGREGFRFLPQTTVEKGDEVVVIMERDSKANSRYEYKLLATHRTSTLEKELNEAYREGFILKGTFSRGESMAVLERPAGSRF